MRQTLLHGPSDSEFLPSDSDTIATTTKDAEPFTKARRQRQLIECFFPGCNLSFIRRDAFDRHEFIHNQIKKYSCIDCKSKYITQSHLRRHIRSSHQIYSDTKIKCQHESCAMEFSNTTGMKRHYKQRHLEEKPYSCKECDEKFYRKMQLRKHLTKHTGVFPYNCDKCGQGSVNLKAHEHHMVGHKSYECNICGETVQKWSLLMVHRREMHNKNQCVICKQVFSNKSNMQSHMRIHSAEKNVFPCTETGCEKFYFHMKNLKAHIRIKHRQERSWECYRCHRTLSTKQKVNMHLKFHHMPKLNKIKVKVQRKIATKVKDRPTLLRNKRGINSKKLKSTAAILTGVIAVNKIVEKMIINGEGKNVQIEIIQDNVVEE